MPTVSVILPTLNRAWALGRALRGLVGQSFEDWELILVDDGSVDATIDIRRRLKEFLGERYQDVVTSRQGTSAARNEGLKRSRGQYVAFLDSDDYWLPHKLECQISALKEDREARLCFTAFSTFSDDGAVLRANHPIHRDFEGSIYPQILRIRNNCIVTPSVLASRDLLFDAGLFDESMHVCEDIDLWTRASRQCRVLAIRAPYVAVHIRDGEAFPFVQNLQGRADLYKKSVTLDPELPAAFVFALYAEVLATYLAVADAQGSVPITRILKWGSEQLMVAGPASSVDDLHDILLDTIEFIRNPVLPQGVRLRVDAQVDEHALRRVLGALEGR
jgi:hypothetical protein